MIVGLGVDIVDVDRFQASLVRTPGLAERLFTPAERAAGRSERLAARFAAKEAVAKALGAPPGLSWQDAEIETSEDGAPHLVLRGTVAQAAARRGAGSWHVSLTHDGGMAMAVVVLES
jgi:holo-[acyl-carrier protein] synthase